MNKAFEYHKSRENIGKQIIATNEKPSIKLVTPFDAAENPSQYEQSNEQFVVGSICDDSSGNDVFDLASKMYSLDNIMTSQRKCELDEQYQNRNNTNITRESKIK